MLDFVRRSDLWQLTLVCYQSAAVLNSRLFESPFMLGFFDTPNSSLKRVCIIVLSAVKHRELRVMY
jgi:hypothetical protein